MTIYIGLDLAWSGKNLTGAATLEGGPEGARLVEPPLLLRTLDEITAYVERHAAAGPAIVAVDAPLLVPNEEGRRPAEAEIGRIFQRYEAGAHPANRRRLAGENGEVRGELLVAALAKLAEPFAHVERIEAGEPGRLVTEVFPHPAMVAIFGLAKTLKYKARPGRSDAVRLEAWKSYQAHMLALANADPPLAGHEELLATDVSGLRGLRLKGYEDQIDGLMCAYIALYAHRWGAARCRTFGDMQGGYIFTPVPPELWQAPSAEL